MWKYPLKLYIKIHIKGKICEYCHFLFYSQFYHSSHFIANGTTSSQNQFPIGQIHFPTKFVIIKTFTPHERWHIPPVQEPQSMCTRNVRQNTAQHHEDVNSSHAKWINIPCQDNDRHGYPPHQNIYIIYNYEICDTMHSDRELSIGAEMPKGAERHIMYIRSTYINEHFTFPFAFALSFVGINHSQTAQCQQDE